MSNTYTVPGLTRSEVVTEQRDNPRPDDCAYCQTATPVGHWPLSTCRSSFLADAAGVDRLTRTHCTCDSCF